MTPAELLGIKLGIDGSPKAIVTSEKAGQQKLLASAMLPKDMQPSRKEFEALGFVFGPDIDDLFIEGTLPAGWEKRGSDHDMWSYIHDADGVERVSIFYKDAFYDRRAFMNLNKAK